MRLPLSENEASSFGERGFLFRRMRLPPSKNEALFFEE
jgi:hypothetical protein